MSTWLNRLRRAPLRGPRPSIPPHELRSAASAMHVRVFLGSAMTPSSPSSGVGNVAIADLPRAGRRLLVPVSGREGVMAVLRHE